MDKQREIFEALSKEFSERFQAESKRLVLDMEDKQTLLSPEVIEAFTIFNEITARRSKAQTEAILSAVATIITRYVPND